MDNLCDCFDEEIISDDILSFIYLHSFIRKDGVDLYWSSLSVCYFPVFPQQYFLHMLRECISLGLLQDKKDFQQEQKYIS